MSIGERISELRKKAGLSQGQLAEIMGITRQAVSKWENDIASPDTIKLIQLSDVLNTEVEYLATGKHPVYEPAPIVVNLVKKTDSPPEKIVEKIIEKPIVTTVTRRVIRIKYRQDPFILGVVGAVCFVAGFLISYLFFV